MRDSRKVRLPARRPCRPAPARVAAGLSAVALLWPVLARAQAPAAPRFRPLQAGQVVPEPTFQRVFLDLPTDQRIRAQMARERPQGPPPPPEPPPLPPSAPIRTWAPLSEVIEPAYTCDGRLYFEQINAERYGWDLGLIHPVVSAGVFCFDTLTLPYRIGTAPCRCYECDAGYCLPGDPVPLLLYPPELSLTGALTEAGTVGLLAVIFP